MGVNFTTGTVKAVHENEGIQTDTDSHTPTRTEWGAFPDNRKKMARVALNPDLKDRT